MSDGRHSIPVLLQPSVGTASAEELSENYQKLFHEFSRDECKTKEQELRASLQQLDLLTFHNQRLTKRIENLQESSAAKSSPGWLVGSAKKELERTKVLLETTGGELTKEIERNESLHKELYEVKSLYTQHSNVFETRILELEKKAEELQNELTRSHLASEDALSTLRQEKRELDNELEQTRSELRIKKVFMEKNEYKLKGGDDTFRAEMIVLRDTLSINPENSFEPQTDKFNELQDRIDNESNELIASFRQLQLNAKDYLKSLEVKSESSYDLGFKVKNASKVWQQNLQTLAVKLASAQSRILDLTAEKEKLVKVNEHDSNRAATLETEIARLKEELNRHKEHTLNPNGSMHPPKTGDGVENCTAPQDDDEEEEFVYPVNPEKKESPEHSSQLNENTLHPTTIMTPQTRFVSDTDSSTSSNGNVGTHALERDIGRSSKNEEDAIRATLIKKHYESRISQLTEQLQLANRKSVQLHTSLKVIQEKLVDSENQKLRSEQENVKLQNELSRLREKLNEDRANHDKQVKEMEGWTEQRQNKIRELNDQLSRYEAGTSRNE
ncbi:12724_t:CDS:10 [Cetraspora pellucida]|uniref:12724_t:CDS:1 n=1 Tax=Cetraspora pellucida TaxID=1433469 RepID=A0ACA9K1E2_9GLOM|nr:12724_t:CDS:10 [Cetraspora pellucida]